MSSNSYRFHSFDSVYFNKIPNQFDIVPPSCIAQIEHLFIYDICDLTFTNF